MKFKKSKINIYIALLIVVPLFGNAQSIVIEDGEVVTCGGVFLDDGGVGGGPYTPGNNYTFTICPDDPDDVVTLTFNAFALYQSPNPNNSDYLTIYDGNSTAAASLGSYTGNALQGLPVTGTVNNTSGCLTFVFQSNPNGGGTFPGWEASLACTTPCAPPTAASEISNPEPVGNEQSIGVCLNAPITFSDIGSVAQPTFNLEYWIWNFDDGTIDTLTTSEDVIHSFTEPGEYLVTLSVVDNNGCRSSNIDPLQILVSTIPIFNTNFLSPVCIGDGESNIDGSAVQSVTWTALPPQVVAGETYLADGAGFSYTSTLTFDFFDAGAVLETCVDFQDIFVNMEHSYLGDLQMSITCPDGTNVIMLEWPNNGGGTYLGEAVDNAAITPPAQGIGYLYSWAPGQTNGNLDDATTVLVDGPPPLTSGQTVPAGTYQSDFDLCDLVGCPLNGDWTFNVLDNLGLDDGFIFEWGIGFNPALFPDVTTFTPVIGLETDSSWWEGPNITNISSNGNIINTSYTATGLYDYTFFTTNNFGCTFDTTITVEVIEGPEITAGPNLTYCDQPVTLQAGLVGSGSVDDLIWTWTPATGLSNPNIQNPTAEVDQTTIYTVTAFPIGLPGCIITDQVTVSPDALSNPGLDTDTTLCYNSPISFLTDYLDGDPALNGVWTDQIGNEVSNQINPTDFVDGGNLNYTYTVTNGTCEGISNLTIVYLPATDATCCQTNAQAGPDAVACDLIYQLNADNALGEGTWTGPSDVVFSEIHDPHAIATCTSPGGGSRTLTWTDNNGFQCSVQDNIDIQFSDPLQLIVIPENANCYNECTGGAVGIADGGTVVGGNYVYEWFEDGAPGLIPQTRDSLCAGIHMVKVIDNFGCADSTTFELGEPAAQELFITQTPPLCAQSCDGKVEIISPGAVKYSFDDGFTFRSVKIGRLCQGEHIVVAQNANGCEISQRVSLVDPPKFVADFNVNPIPTTTKNTRITFQDISTPGPIKNSLYTYGDNPILGESDFRISSFTFPRDTSGTYPVTLISTNINGCSDTLTKQVIIQDELLWFIPNSFSPNEDGINDMWKPVGTTIDATDYKLTIFDRWGSQVFTTTEIEEGWNGNDSGNEYYVKTGVYTYLIKVTSATTEEKFEFTGFITVIR